MTTTPEDPGDDEAPRWTGRASVTPPEPAAPTGRASVGAGSVTGRASVPERSPAAGRSSVASRPPVPPSAAGPMVPPTYGTKKKRLKPRWGRIALVTVIALALIGGGGALWAFLYVKHVNDNLKRTDSIDNMVGGNRPTKTVDGALNILLLGSDSRDPDEPIDVGGNWRTDTIELMHIPASHDKAYLISFPRDLWIHIPQSKSSQYGNTDAKINAASAWGGVPLTVETVEQYTGVRIDHLALIDFAGFVQVVDALGGVDLYIDQTITSIHSPYRTFAKGTHHFNGAEALDWVRQRKQFPDGDFARIRHQQEFLKAIMDKAISAGTVTNLSKLTSFVSSVSKAITVDQDFSLIDVAWQFHSLKSSDLTFITCPNDGTGTIDGQSVVLNDPAKASALFTAVNQDTVAQWLTRPGNSK